MLRLEGVEMRGVLVAFGLLASLGSVAQELSPPPPPPLTTDPAPDVVSSVRLTHGELVLTPGYSFGRSFGFFVSGWSARYFFTPVRRTGAHFYADHFLQHPSEVALDSDRGLNGTFYLWPQTALTLRAAVLLGGIRLGLSGGLGVIHYLSPGWRLEAAGWLASGSQQEVRVGTSWLTEPAPGNAFFGRFLHRAELRGFNAAQWSFYATPIGPEQFLARNQHVGLRWETLAIRSPTIAFGVNAGVGVARWTDEAGGYVSALELNYGISAELEVTGWLSLTPQLVGQWNRSFDGRFRNYSIGPYLGLVLRP